MFLVTDAGRLRIWLAAFLLACHVLLVANLAFRWSPTPDEPAYIAGGLLIWQYGHFNLYSVNPPLARLLAALPAFLMEPVRGWAGFDYHAQDRPEFHMGRELMVSHPTTWRRFLVLGRAHGVCLGNLRGRDLWPVGQRALWSERWTAGAGVVVPFSKHSDLDA